ncbi:MAG: sugar phosphate isomerase/epimerase [Clostridia bacterium]|nr:sugar phosphate isomerase/epimerase [Clostridia bacterium]
MKIGTCVYLSSSREDMKNKFQLLKDNEFTTCQLLSWNMADFTDENAAMVNELCAEYGIEISAFWCGWSGPVHWNFYEGQETLGLVSPTYRWQRMQDLKKGSDFAEKIGVTDIATHMGYIPENPYDINYAGFCCAVRDVAQYMKRKGQYLLFETGQETPVTMLRCFETVGMDNLGVNLDTGNLILYGKANPVDALDVIGKYVRNFHIKDGFYPVNGHNLGREAKVGEGKCDFVALCKKLKELGYDGHMTIEREIEGTQQNIDILDTRKYINDILASL